MAASDKGDPNVDRTAAVIAKLSTLPDGMNAEEREMYEKAKKGGVGGGGGGSLEAEDRTGLSWKKVERFYPNNGPGGGNKLMNEKNKKEGDGGGSRKDALVFHRLRDRRGPQVWPLTYFFCLLFVKNH